MRQCSNCRGTTLPPARSAQSGYSKNLLKTLRRKKVPPSLKLNIWLLLVIFFFSCVSNRRHSNKRICPDSGTSDDDEAFEFSRWLTVQATDDTIPMLLATKSLAHVPLKITPHRTLNSCKGVVRS